MKLFEKTNGNNEIIRFVWMVAIILLFAVTRLWKLSTIPGGMHFDEAATAYSALCLSEYGVDRYLKSWPVYLMNLEGGQSIMYAYLCILLFKVFGYNLWIYRLPAVIFSFLTLIYGMKIMKKVFPELVYAPLIYGSLVVVCPYFIMASRIGLDCNLMLGMSTVFLYYFICALEGNNWRAYLTAGIVGGLVLYTYALSYIVMPVFLAVSFLYVIWIKRLQFRNWVIMAIPVGLLAIPLIMVQIVNMFDLPEMQLGIFTITKMGQYRASELGLPKWENLMNAVKFIFTWDDLAYNSIPGTPVLYGITNIFFAIGLWGIINRVIKVYKDNCGTVLITLWFGVMLLLGSLTYTTVNKMNAIYAVMVMLAVYGMWCILGSCKKLCYVFRGAVLCIYAMVFIGFCTYYYGGDYMMERNPLSYFSEDIGEAYEDIINNPIICSKQTQMAQNSVFLGLAASMSPYEYASEIWTESFMCGGLTGTSPEYNYIVEDKYGEFMQELRNAGFTEIDYEGYSLFYIE